MDIGLSLWPFQLDNSGACYNRRNNGSFTRRGFSSRKYDYRKNIKAFLKTVYIRVCHPNNLGNNRLELNFERHRVNWTYLTQVTSLVLAKV